MNTSVKLVDDAVIKIRKVEGQIGEKIKAKIYAVLKKNAGFKKVKEIGNIFNLPSSKEKIVDNEYSTKELTTFKYPPITSVDVERTFSMLKTVLRPNRMSFTFDNLKKNLFIYICKYIFIYYYFLNYVLSF